jgi:hypothetical protein
LVTRFVKSERAAWLKWILKTNLTAIGNDPKRHDAATHARFWASMQPGASNTAAPKRPAPAPVAQPVKRQKNEDAPIAQPETTPKKKEKKKEQEEKVAKPITSKATAESSAVAAALLEEKGPQLARGVLPRRAKL